MSGFVAIFNRDGRPVESRLLRHMTTAMAIPCPDAQEVWHDSQIGFGHTLLKTTWESAYEQQPLSLDGKVWITGDIRLDRRNELIEQLGATDPVKAQAADVDLVLQAYRAWGEACLERLSGDFAFAIWDSVTQQLFCARDQFGVVPLYYAELGNTLIVGNHLNCLRLHPKVSDTLNEQAVGDFLLFGMNMNMATTTFADIQKLPPAHRLTCSLDRQQVQRYWQLPEAVEYVRHKRPETYVEQFQELFERAVGDRLRTDRVGTHLSGGLDSTSIAVTAHRLMAKQNTSIDFRAYSIVYDHLVDEQEGEYAAQVAEMAGFPLEYLVAEDYIQQAPAEQPIHIHPEPLMIANQVAEVEILRRISGYSRTLLAGFGGDPALYPTPSYWHRLLQRGQIHFLMADMWNHLHTFGRPPLLGISTQLRQWKNRASTHSEIALPEWLNPDFVKRTNLKERLQAKLSEVPQKDRYGMTFAPLWPSIFAWSDPGFSGVPVKVRFPFFDLCLVQYLLSVPSSPWLEDKHLLRESMAGCLPESVRQRPKTPLGLSPHYKLMKQRGLQPWMESLATISELSPYVSGDHLVKMLQMLESLSSSRYSCGMSVIAFAHWLYYQGSAMSKQRPNFLATIH